MANPWNKRFVKFVQGSTAQLPAQNEYQIHTSSFTDGVLFSYTQRQGRSLCATESLYYIAGAAFLFISLVLVVPSNLSSSQQGGDILDSFDALQDLEFDEFVEVSYQQVLLRSPEMVTSMGLSQSLGIRDDQLDNICYAYVDETYELKAGIQEILGSYNRSELDYDQRISYDSYSWLLSDWMAEHEYMYHFYPVTHGFSRQNDLFRFFEDEQPLETLGEC